MPALPHAEVEDEQNLMSGALSKDDVIIKFSDLFGETLVKDLQHSEWKKRLDAIEAVLAKVKDGSLNTCSSAVVQGLAHLPGWSEKNFQVQARMIEVVSLLAAQAPAFSKRDGCVAIVGMFEKLPDVKLKGPTAVALTAISEAVGPSFVATLLHTKAKGHTNPKLMSETLAWITTAIEEFGLACFNVKVGSCCCTMLYQGPACATVTAGNCPCCCAPVSVLRGEQVPVLERAPVVLLCTCSHCSPGSRRTLATPTGVCARTRARWWAPCTDSWARPWATCSVAT
jgi:hypothetical protein